MRYFDHGEIHHYSIRYRLIAVLNPNPQKYSETHKHIGVPFIHVGVPFIHGRRRPKPGCRWHARVGSFSAPSLLGVGAQRWSVAGGLGRRALLGVGKQPLQGFRLVGDFLVAHPDRGDRGVAGGELVQEIIAEGRPGGEHGGCHTADCNAGF